MDFAVLSVVLGLLAAALFARRPAGAARQRWHGRLVALVVALLAVLCLGALGLALPPGVPRVDGTGLLLTDLAGLAALFAVVHALGAAPGAARLRAVGLGLGLACFCAAAGCFALGVRAQRRSSPELTEALLAAWDGTLAPAPLLALGFGLASALLLAWGIAAPELHEAEPAWRRDELLRLPCTTVAALVLVLALGL